MLDPALMAEQAEIHTPAHRGVAVEAAQQAAAAAAAVKLMVLVVAVVAAAVVVEMALPYRHLC
jgi:hypothetical protein